MASDFHTHRPNSAARALVSCCMEELSRYPLASLELHPWKLPDRWEGVPERFRVALRGAAALGEVGLDRLRGAAFAVQQEYLDALLALAEAENKPVVLHCVRALPELQAMRKRYHRLPMLFHGFRGKPEKLEELRRAGFHLSLGAGALNDAALFAHLNATGLHRIGFETDDSPETVESLLSRAAELLAMPVTRLEMETDRTFAAFLGL